jgi:phage terminase Nu1 subunit (DNA packaging protein)
MADTATHWSISGLSIELNMDRRTLGKVVASLEPVRENEKTKTKYYLMAPVMWAIIKNYTGEGNPAGEKSRLDRLRADKVEFELQIQRGEYAPIQSLKFAVGDMAGQIKSILDSVPKQVKNSLPSLRAKEIKILERELVKAQNAASKIQIVFDTDDSSG